MNPQRPRGRLPALWLMATAFSLAIFFVLRAWSPNEDPKHSWCAMRRLSGLACPTCGLTRAFALLAKGRPSDASRLHPLVAPLAVELGIAWMLTGVASVRPRWSVPWRAAIAVLCATIAAFLFVWMYRLATGTLPP